MGNTPQRFCLLTVGRAGSTSLMTRLEQFPDIAVPNKNLRCTSNELVHPGRVAKYMKRYSEMCGRPIGSQDELIDSFYAFNEGFAFAGFKSMPNRHADLQAFTDRKDIRFITLTRNDITSTVASFLIAASTGTFKREGEPHLLKWRFNPSTDAPRALQTLGYVQRSHSQLRLIPNAIRLTYEDLCAPGFRSAALDAYFGRPISLEHPKPPTFAGDYLENWEEFKAFIEEAGERADLRK